MQYPDDAITTESCGVISVRCSIARIRGMLVNTYIYAIQSKIIYRIDLLTHVIIHKCYYLVRKNIFVER